jgi:glycosyltransferase involved in cell wall biosynthesis
MVFGGCEDFGIALAEAQACGTPLIAFARGGARDIVRERFGSSAQPTGVLFERQSVAAIKEAVDVFEQNKGAISPLACRTNALRFSEQRFDNEILGYMAHALAEYL